MALRFPNCGECGASIRSHDDEVCPFCGAALPWELWDEISARRIELVEADALTFEAAIYRVERSDAYAGQKLRARRARMRLRPKRPKLDAQGNIQTPATAEATLAVVGGGVLTILAIILMRGNGLALLVPIMYGALLATLEWRKRQRTEERLAKKRKAYFLGGHSFPLAAGVLEVAAPATHGEGDDAKRARAVVLHTAKGDQHVLLAPTDLEIEPGQVGIATVRGLDLLSFSVHDRIQ